MSIQVFVYGTLKSGHRNHHYLEQADFIGHHVTDKCFSMYEYDDFPAVTQNGSHAVSGEIYRINQQQFEMLDELEWYPRLYQRIEIQTSHELAWMYIVKPELCRDKKLLDGSWL